MFNNNSTFCSLDVEALVHLLDPTARRSGEGWMLRCPAHDDLHPSCSISAGTKQPYIVRCHAGCSQDAVLAAIRSRTSGSVAPSSVAAPTPPPTKAVEPLPGPPAWPQEWSTHHLPNVAGRWVYIDGEGRPIMGVVRVVELGADGTPKKSYRQGCVGWSGSGHGPDSQPGKQLRWTAMPSGRPLYRLDLVARSPKRILVVEGEKCVDRLASIGVPATTSAGGAGAAEKTDWTALRGRKVLIWPDHDDPGRKYAAKVAALLDGIAASVRILEPPEDAPAGWDAADLVEEAASPEVALARVRDIVRGTGTPPSSAAEAEHGAPTTATTSTELDKWLEGEPVPLGEDDTDVVALQLSLLPQALADLSTGIARELDIDPAMAAIYGLSVLATAVARGFRVQVTPTWSEPVGLYVAVVADASAGKGPVFSPLMAPLYDYQHDALAAWEVAHREWKAHKANKEKAGRAKDADMYNATLSVLEHDAKEPKEPTMIIDDATVESMVIYSASQGGAIGVHTEEGAGPFGAIAGRYSDIGPDLAHWCQGFSGKPMVVHRVSRPSLRLQKPAWTMGIMCQPSVIRDLAGVHGVMDQGFFARFLFAYPRATLRPKPKAERPDCEPKILQRWNDLVRGILDAHDGLSARRVLQLTDTASERLYELDDEVKRRKAPGGDLYGMTSWAGKIVGTLGVRVAALFAVADLGLKPRGEGGASTDTPDAKVPVMLRHVERAAKLLPYFVAHARHAHVEAGRDPLLAAACTVLTWLRGRGEEVVAVRDLWQGLKGRAWCRRVAALQGPIKALVEHGWLRPLEDEETPTKGRPRSPRFRLHPRALEADPPPPEIPETPRSHEPTRPAAFVGASGMPSEVVEPDQEDDDDDDDMNDDLNDDDGHRHFDPDDDLKSVEDDPEPEPECPTSTDCARDPCGRPDELDQDAIMASMLDDD